jgi:3',5'-cyclic AMP phosphodiesterase CpdA
MRKGKIAAILFMLLSAAVTVLAVQDQHIAQKLVELEMLPGKFTFAVIGDDRSGGDIYKKLVVMVMAHKPAFVVNTGDMISSPVDRRGWRKFWEMSKPITVPYFLTVGNHDVHPRVPFSEQTYQEEVDLPGNELYYSFTAGNSLFIVLDSFIAGQEKKITGEQFKWLEATLARSRKKHKFIFVHHPLLTIPGKGRHSGTSLDLYPKDRDRLEALFVKSEVDAVFCGHEHFYHRKTIDGITHIITGGGGAPLYTNNNNGGFHHFVIMTVDGDAVRGKVIDSSGEVRDRF